MKRILSATTIILCCCGGASAQALNPTGEEIDAFAEADANEDLVLTLNEFRVFVRAMAEAGQPTAKQIRFFGAYGFAFGIADANKDGVLTPMELRQGDEAYRTEGL